MRRRKGFYEDPEDSGRYPKWATGLLRILAAIGIIGWLPTWLFSL